MSTFKENAGRFFEKAGEIASDGEDFFTFVFPVVFGLAVIAALLVGWAAGMALLGAAGVMALVALISSYTSDGAWELANIITPPPLYSELP